MTKKSGLTKGMIGLVIGCFSLILLAGCGSNGALTDGTYMMEVSSIDDKTVSGVLGELSENSGGPGGQGGGMGQMPEGEMNSGEMPSREDMPTDQSGMPEDGTMPSGDRGGGFPGGNGFTASEDEEKGTFTINDDTAVTMEFMQNSQDATVDSISEGTIIEVTVKNGVATEIVIRSMNMGSGGFGGNGEAPSMDGTTDSSVATSDATI